MGSRRRIRRKVVRQDQRVVRREQVNVRGEAEHIIQCAAEREGRVVTFGPLLFFSTETGDAWVLDPSDGLARCLARDGDALPLGIHETPESFGVEWEAAFEFQGDAMIFREALRERAVLGYPVREIKQAIRRMRRA